MLVGVMVLIAAAYAWLVTTGDQITERNCNRIEQGMSEAEVEAIMGRKPDGVITVEGIELQRTWIGRTGSIDVAYDDNGHVVSRMPFMRTGEPSLLDRLQSWCADCLVPKGS
jgi:hypothetical protein